LKLDALDHPKTHALTALLDISRPTAIGHLELLWAFTGKNAPQGNIGKWPDGAIARACDWIGPPEQFLNALIESRFLDIDAVHRVSVHDWHEHAPGWVRAKLKGLNQDFVRLTPGDSPPRPAVKQGNPTGSPPGSPQGTAPSILVQGSEGKGREVLELVPQDGTNGHAAESPTDSVHRVFDHWRTTYAHPKAQLDDKRRKVIKTALNAYSEADLIAAVSGYQKSAHHMGKNERRAVYDDIELFLRDAKHIDAGLAFAKQAGDEKWM